MRMGIFKHQLAASLAAADQVILYQGADLDWSLNAVAAELNGCVCHSIEEVIASICAQARCGDHVLIMSNGGFGAIHERLLQALQEQVKTKP